VSSSVALCSSAAPSDATEKASLPTGSGGLAVTTTVSIVDACEAVAQRVAATNAIENFLPAIFSRYLPKRHYRRRLRQAERHKSVTGSGEMSMPVALSAQL
jgi:hypothetical protein